MSATHQPRPAQEFDGRIVDMVLEPFKGRTTLYVSEVAKVLMCSHQHILDLIDERELGAVDLGNGKHRFFRVPVKELRKFLEARNSLLPG